MKLSDYVNACNSNKDNEKIQSSEISVSQHSNNLNEMLEKYSTYNSNELMNEFIRVTIEKKKNGELNSNELENLKKTIVPYLNDAQKNELNRLLQLVQNV